MDHVSLAGAARSKLPPLFARRVRHLALPGKGVDVNKTTRLGGLDFGVQHFWVSDVTLQHENHVLAFAEWVKVFAGDEKLTTALLDRLAHHATVIATKGKSYRMRKRTTDEKPPQTNPLTLPKPGRRS